MSLQLSSHTFSVLHTCADSIYSLQFNIVANISVAYKGSWDHYTEELKSKMSDN